MVLPPCRPPVPSGRAAEQRMRGPAAAGVQVLAEGAGCAHHRPCAKVLHDALLGAPAAVVPQPASPGLVAHMWRPERWADDRAELAVVTGDAAAG